LSLSRFVDRSKRALTGKPHTSKEKVEHPQGLEVVSEGQDPIVEYVSLLWPPNIIAERDSTVALHGLNGHREKTWTAINGIHWLRLLSEGLPQACILC
jgi:hypothetical protein